MSSTPQSTTIGVTGLYKRRKKLYERHARLYSHDASFSKLRIPTELRMPLQDHVPPSGIATNDTDDGTPNDCIVQTSAEHHESPLNDGAGCSRSGDDISSAVTIDNDSGAYAMNVEHIEDTDTEDGENSTDGKESSATSSEEESQEPLGCTKEDESNMFSITNIMNCSQSMRLKNWVTTIHMLAYIIAISLRGKLTYAITSMMLMNLDAMFVNSGLPSSMKQLWQMLLRNDNAGTTRHLYCQHCIDYVGIGKKPNQDCSCGECGPGKSSKSLAYFIEVKIAPQLQQLFSDPTVICDLRYRFTRQKKNADALEDIYDGRSYSQKCQPGQFLRNENNFSFTIFTDGCQVSKSSPTSAWPILLQINEFSPHARKRHVLLAGVWVDTVHPDLNMLLKPTAVELDQLYHQGLTWTNPITETLLTSKFITLNCVADSVARYEILNMTRFNGKFGCTFCYAEGQHISVKGVKRVFPIDDSVPSRTDYEIRQHMQEAYLTRKKKYGVKGHSALAILEEFDLSSGVGVDSMHNVYLGVVKLHTMLLLYDNANEIWYAGSPSKISAIDLRLMQIKTPSRIARRPRLLKFIRQWKASEWRNWIQYYALPCLEGIIRDVDLNHLALLSRATYILNKDSIDAEQLREARLLIKQYVKQFQEIFGIKYMRYNIHLLTHLVDTVENWGPFWTHSAFPFESWNKKIIEKVTSANSRPLQIVTRFLMIRFVEGLLVNPEIADRTKQMIRSVLTKDLKKRDVSVNLTPAMSRFSGIGNSDNRSPYNWESETLSSAGYQPKNVCFFEHAIINGIDFRSRDKTNKRNTRFCNKFLHCRRIGYGEILKIVSFRDNEELIQGFLVERVCSLGTAFGACNIENAAFSSFKEFVSIEDQLVPAMVIETLNERRIIAMPNLWETD